MALTPQDVQNKVFSPTRFRTGYNEDEVDTFLDEVEAELTRLLDENSDLRRQLDEARRSGGGGPGVPAQILEENQGLRRQLDEARRQIAQAQAQAAQAARERGQQPQPPAPQQGGAPTTVISAVGTSGPPARAGGNPQVEADIEQRVARTLVLAQRTADEALREARAESERARREARADADRIIGEARAHVAEQLGGLEDDKRRLEGQVEQLRAFEREYRTRLRAYLEMQLRDLDGMPTQPAVGAGGPPRPGLNPGGGPTPPAVGMGPSGAAQSPAHQPTFPPGPPLPAGAAMARDNGHGRPDMDATRRDAPGMQEF
ncbi:cell division initiation protein [Frankia casuarinae]|uniref:Cell wall synthesis protein Wag31 n=2 Tax=Frankia casuarinae (strain DSM 45818 / CECT 9043 / HFP020203 / CcI3) TaxID=106370 RepID=Q2JD42_FRACC|nr:MULTISPECIES: DivIVA domain-containing protein [Frankia]ABD10800.1 DivIVA [Frankia casuarinae]ETA03065.1 cell division initiation protein [Frankia sp. CcI6]EYT92926.1 cell division initiation protein [Frankia casuarinae]KDA44031.1 cell division initiation protein [Frankia sp. BMG5.23]KEZ37635.1 DivIVA domain [Frankia sp. CeD]